MTGPQHPAAEEDANGLSYPLPKAGSRVLGGWDRHRRCPLWSAWTTAL
ncbi:hypothetical protein OHS70_36960 [Streptomyces sp. NBC_00390]